MNEAGKSLTSYNAKAKLPLILVLFIPCLFALFSSLDNDIWFLLNHGRYVVANGIPHIEPFTIHQDFHFVMQQWLSSVIFWVSYSAVGDMGIKILTMFFYIITVYIIYKLCMKVSENNFFVSFSITAVTSIIFMFFMVSRPFIFSTPLFALELYLLESYKKKNEKKYLYFLPFLSALLINLQAAMWPMFFVLILPYAVETIKFKIGPLKNEGAEKKRLLVFSLLSVPAGFINPYGFEAMTYLFRSYGYAQINMVVQEMRPLNINESLGKIAFACLIVVASVYFFYKKGEKKIRYIFLALGTGYMTLSSYRNLSFFALCAFFPLSAYLKDFELPVKQNKDIKKTSRIRRVLIGLIVLVLPLGFYGASVSSREDVESYDLLNGALDFIIDEGETNDVILYTGYDTGSMAEFRGIEPYIDPRAEVFVKRNNHKADIFQEYTALQLGQIYYKDILEKYDFTHILLTSGDIMYTYLKHDSNYTAVYANDTYVLYEPS